MADLAALVVRMQADNSAYVKALDQATSKLKKFSDDQNGLLDKLGDSFADLGEGIAAAFAVDKIVEFAASAIEAGASLQKFSENSGASVELLGSLQIAMSGSGVGGESLETAFKKLNVAAAEAAGDGTSKAGVAFRALGIDVHDASGNIKTVNTLFDEIADKYATSANGADKTAASVALLGKAGEKLTATLNQGSAALHAQEQAAIDAGAVFSGPLAEQAEAAEKSLATLANTVKGELQVAIATQLAPAILQVVDAFKGLTSESDAFQSIGIILTAVFRGIAAIIIEVKREIDTILTPIQALGAYGAAAVEALKGNTKQASEIISEFNADAVAKQTTALNALGNVFKNNADKQISEAERGAKGAAAAGKGTDTIGNIAAIEKADAADKALEKFAQGLQAQAQSFGLGAVAAAQYKLSVGELSKDLAVASDKGKAAAASAIAYAKVLQSKEDDKTIQDATDKLSEQVIKLNQSDVAAEQYALTHGKLAQALNRTADGGEAARAKLTELSNALIDEKDTKAVEAINDKLDTMNGKLVAAAQHAFDLQNKGLVQDLTARGAAGAPGLAVVQQARDAETAQAEFNEVLAQSQKLESQYGIEIAKVQLLQAQGAIGDTAAQNKIQAIQTQEIASQQQFGSQLAAIASSGDFPKLTEQSQAFNLQIIDLQKNTNQLENQIRGQLEDAFANNFSDLITGAKGFKAAFTDMVKSIQKDLANMVSKDLAQSIFGQSGPAGGAAGLLAGIFGNKGGNSSNGFGFLSNLFGGAGGSSTQPAAQMDAISDALGAANANSLTPVFSSLAGLAGGGTISRGGMAVVGENGPELAYSGSKDMQITPMSGGGKGSMSVSNTFVLSAPGGTITRQSQSQAAAAAARSISISARRNGG